MRVPGRLQYSRLPLRSIAASNHGIKIHVFRPGVHVTPADRTSSQSHYGRKSMWPAGRAASRRESSAPRELDPHHPRSKRACPQWRTFHPFFRSALALALWSSGVAPPKALQMNYQYPQAKKEKKEGPGSARSGRHSPHSEGSRRSWFSRFRGARQSRAPAQSRAFFFLFFWFHQLRGRKRLSELSAQPQL